MSKSKKNNIAFSLISFVICIILIVGVVIGNIACKMNEGVITSWLCGYGFSEDSAETQAARESGYALAEDVEEEGAVLLKNNGVLPLSEGAKVNVFGWSGNDDGFMAQGTGSGTGSRNDLVTFLGGLETAGIEYNKALAKAYDDLDWHRVGLSGNMVIEAGDANYANFFGVAEAPEDFYTNDLIKNAKDFSNTAIVVLGRLMGEGNDFSKNQTLSDGQHQIGGTDTTRKLQSLSAREEKMIEVVTQNFENVIIVINTGNPLELGIADRDTIDAVVDMGFPGTRGTIGIGNLLIGKVDFSGRLADTWAYDLSTAAAYATSGIEGVARYNDQSGHFSYGEYRENIYSGYYWYETADVAGFWNSDFAKNRWNLTNGYKDVVQYPFGYGLSYNVDPETKTNAFSWEISESNVSNGTVLNKDGDMEITVKVTNVGDRGGRDVVQLYYSAPYTAGGIEKSAIKLGAFSKTAYLEPGQFELVKLTLHVEEMKSYDCYDRNNNGFMGYELEEGDYTLSLRTDVHTPKADLESIVVKVADGGIRYETDSVTGTTVTNQFTNYTNTVSGASSTVNEPFVTAAGKQTFSIDGSQNPGTITYMTRADFVGTFPQEKGADKAGGNMFANLNDVTAPVQENNVESTTWNGSSTLTLSDMAGKAYEDPAWDELVNRLSLEQAQILIGYGGFGTRAIEQIGKPATVDADGPSGFNTAVTGGNNLKACNYPSDTVLAQTWNWYIAYQVGKAIGIEGKALGISGWYGPGANIHRSAMGGRNFEYYSEDAYLAGVICAYHVLGAKEEGVMAYIKHIGTNEDDKYRTVSSGRYNWLTEQTLRENVLKPFEFAIKIGKANGLMGAATRTGGMRSTGSYALLTAVVRNEWGFRGTVITDYYCSGTINDSDECIRTGTSQMLFHANVGFDDSNSATAQKYLHMRAKDILYAYVETQHYAATAQGLESSSLIGVTSGSAVFAWWIPVLVGADVFVGIMVLYWMFCAGRALFPEKKR